MENLHTATTSKKEAINHLHGNEIVNSSECHLKYLMIAIAVKNVSIIKEDPLRAHFYSMMTLTGLMFLQECKAYGYDCGYFKKGDNKLMQEAINLMLKKIRPYAIPLIEVNGLSDHMLQSACGNSYGDIYE